MHFLAATTPIYQFTKHSSRYILLAHFSNSFKNDDLNGIEEFSGYIPSFRVGVLSSSSLRQAKNIFIVTTTLVSRCAIKEGIDTNKALALSDFYIRKLDTLYNEKEITNFSYSMVIEYTRLINE